jgi:cobalamin synthase
MDEHPVNTPPTTTAADDRRTAGQRRVNIIWETTQAIIAVTVTAAVIYSALVGKESLLLGNAFTLIIAIYFVRMNHTKIGGVSREDEGR